MASIRFRAISSALALALLVFSASVSFAIPAPLRDAVVVGATKNSISAGMAPANDNDINLGFNEIAGASRRSYTSNDSTDNMEIQNKQKKKKVPTSTVNNTDTGSDDMGNSDAAPAPTVDDGSSAVDSRDEAGFADMDEADKNKKTKKAKKAKKAKNVDNDAEEEPTSAGAPTGDTTADDSGSEAGAADSSTSSDANAGSSAASVDDDASD
ncbi:hypothetical protein GALMADRAFT_1366655 [Galerina marginata CBS 339.88]|uniref:Uncharacterized protein n=1 Tax=Galerina marginata (strain CBS 339.88) TaxID=685588 RepID=A0A067T4H4_GALM3|nr:hypothetical protein GALMADRAFT_1366655 [Galerina marginata CBS 339.88]